MPSAKVHGAGGFWKKQIKNSGSQFTVHQIPLHDSDILTGDRSGISFPEPIWFFSLDEAASSAPKVPDAVLSQYGGFPKKRRRLVAHFAIHRRTLRAWNKVNHYSRIASESVSKTDWPLTGEAKEYPFAESLESNR